MSRPSPASHTFRRLLEAIDLLHDHESGHFPDRLFEAARLLFPGTSHSLDLWRKTDGVYQTVLNVPYDPKDRDHILERLGALVPVEHPCYPVIAAGVTTPLQITDFMTLREFKRLELYHVVFKPVEATHQIALPLLTETHVGGLTINRGGRHIFSPEEIQTAAVFGRHVALSHRTAEILAAAREQRPFVETADHLPLRRAGLTRRESEVVQWIAQGKRDREIAAILGISYRTVTQHVRSILAKLKVETRTAAVAALPPEMRSFTHSE